MLEKLKKVGGDCLISLANFNKDTLIGIMAGYVSCIQRSMEHKRTCEIVGRSFQLMPETVERIINRLLPKFLLRVLEKGEIGLSYDEKRFAMSYLNSFMNNECCHKKALAETGIEHGFRNLINLEDWLKEIFRKLISELKPVTQIPLPAYAIHALSA